MRPCASLLVAALIAQIAGPAFAQSPPPPGAQPPGSGKPRTPAEIEAEKAEKAAEHHKRGRELLDQGKLNPAVEALRAAWTLKRSWVAAADLGACEIKLGRWRDAAEHLAFVLRTQPAGEKPEERQRSLELYEQARAKVAGITITTEIDGADVIVNDQIVGLTPLDEGEVFAEPGDVTITAKKVGFLEFQKTLRVPAGKAGSVRITLGRPSSEDRFASHTPTRIPLYVLGGAALVAGGIGAGLMVAGGRKGAQADDALDKLKEDTGSETPCLTTSAECDSLKALRADRDEMVNMGTGFLIGAGVAAVGAIGYAVWLRRAPSDGPSRVSVLPVVSPSASGLWLRGAF